MARPPIKLPKYVGRTLSGIIMTAKNETSEVNRRLYRKITSPARSRFLRLGALISRFTWARDSSPLIASTEWPKPTTKTTKVNRENHEPESHPKNPPFNFMFAGTGKGGRWNPVRDSVNRHQPIRITTITVVICMIRRDF